MKKKILDFLQKNYGWIVAMTTGIWVITAFILKFFKYLNSVYYFNYYKISYEFFNGEELGTLYNFGLSILLIFCACSIIYCFIQLFNFKKKKLKVRTFIGNIILILISNSIAAYSMITMHSILEFIVYMLILILTEIVLTIVILRTDNRENTKEHEFKDILNYLKLLPFYLILIVLCFLISYGVRIQINKSYRIVNQDKVIVYTTHDYYLLLDCEIKDNTLFIYRGKETKASNENLKSELRTFDKIVMK